MALNRSTYIVLAFFFLTGLIGFAYEIIWVHLIGLAMEKTAYAQVLTLAVFVGGVSLGSLISLNFADRVARPMRLFAFIAIVLALLALISPVVIKLSGIVFSYIYREFTAPALLGSSLRLLLRIVVLILPAAVFGATLPVLMSWFVRRSRVVGFAAGELYGMCGLGAASATAILCFLLLPSVGYMMSFYIIIALNIVFAVSAYLISKYSPSERLVIVDTKDTDAYSGIELKREPGQRLPLLFALIVSSFSIIVYQVSIGRALALIFDSTIYTFAIMLIAFLAAVSLGSLLSVLFKDSVRDRFLIFALIHIVSGAAMLAGASVVNPISVKALVVALSYGDTFVVYRVMQFIIVFLVMAVPAALFGAVYSFAGRIYMGDLKEAGRDLGIVYLASVAGVLIAIFSCEYLLFRMLGLMGSILVSALLCMALGCVAVYYTRLGYIPRHAFTAILLIVIPPAFILVPSWDEDVLSSGGAVYASEYSENGMTSDDLLGEIKRKNSVMYFKEGSLSTTSVARGDDGRIMLRIDGSLEATTAREELIVQDLLVDLAMMSVGEPKDVLMVGLGSGVALEAVMTHDVENVECVEVSENVVEASEYFRALNREVLLDSRVSLKSADGRTHVENSGRTYDVIISNPSEPWIYGAASLFTVEYYSAARSALNDGGVMMQRINGGRLSDYDFKVVLRTFAESFFDVALWEVNRGRGDYVLMGSLSSVGFEYKELKERFELELELHQLKDMSITELATLLGFYAMDRAAIMEYAGDVELNTDSGALLEFSAPRDVMSSVLNPLRHDMLKYRRAPLDMLRGLNDTEVKELTDTYTAISLVREAESLIANADEEMAVSVLVDAEALAKGNSDVMGLAAAQYLAIGDKYKDPLTTLRYYAKAVNLSPGNIDALFHLGKSYYLIGELKRSIDILSQLVVLNPQSPRAHWLLALVYRDSGFTGEAQREQEMTLRFRKGVSIE